VCYTQGSAARRTPEEVNGLAETGSRMAHGIEMRMPVQPSWEVRVMMTGDRRSQKHIEGGMPAKGRRRRSRAVVRREQLGKSSARPYPQGMKSGRHRDRKQKRQGQHDVEVPFMKAITDVTGMSP
jgi:hypothetical protein